MKILIDGDGCPVIDIAISVAKKFNIEVVIMCDTSHIFNKEGAKTMVFSKGADSVDFALINYLEKEDIVITQDYGLAAMAMNKASYVINQNGMIYNDENIDRLLYSRHIYKKIRKSGGKTKGPKKRTKEDDINFEKTLNEILELIYFLWKL
nr:YaiI/YqxD family protein [uncultured Terrisporobacter sp.]